jgi:hypothetical protein
LGKEGQVVSLAIFLGMIAEFMNYSDTLRLMEKVGMLRNALLTALLAGAGLFGQSASAKANDFMHLGYHGGVNTVSVNWGRHGYAYGCTNCGTGYAYAAPSYGYNYGYGYPAVGYWGHSAYFPAPAGYWRGYAPSYNWGYAAPYYGYGYGFGYSYPNSYFNYVHPTSTYYPAPAYYTPSYYYTPAWGVPFSYAAPTVTNVYASVTNVAYPQSAAAVPQVTTPVGPVIPAVPPVQGFDYDGGPKRLVPMPRTDGSPAPAANVYNIHLTEAKTDTSKYAFKAYGEKSVSTSDAGSDTVLVKGAGSR